MPKPGLDRVCALQSQKPLRRIAFHGTYYQRLLLIIPRFSRSLCAQDLTSALELALTEFPMV